MGEKLTMQERVRLVFMFGQNGATYRSVAEEFNLLHHERKKTIEPYVSQSVPVRHGASLSFN